MIDQYNRKRVIRGVIAALLSIAAYIVAFYLFKFAWAQITSSFSDSVKSYSTVFAVVCLSIVTVAGILHARAGKGHYGYEDSGVFVPILTDTGGALATTFYANRITTPAYLLSQLLLAAPLQMIKCDRRFRSPLKNSPGLETQLMSLQKQVESQPKRHPISKYPGQEREIFMLARMQRIEFSARKGTVFKKQ